MAITNNVNPGISTHTLKVDSETTAEELREFTETASEDSKLRAKRNEDGSITLYSTTRDSGLWSRISGRAAQRRDLAREAVSMVMDSTLDSAEKSGAGKSGLDKTKDMFISIRALIAFDGAHSLKSGQVTLLAMAAEKSVKALDERPTAEGPSIDDLGDLETTLASVKDGYDTARATPDGLSALAKRTGKLVADDYKAANPGKDAAEKFALSLGKDFKAGLAARLAETLKDAAPRPTDAEIAKFVDDAYNAAAETMLPDRQNEDGTITLGGKTYERKEKLGEGGFGTAYRYEAEDGSEIALKIQNTADDKTFADFAREIPAHRAAYADGHDNVLGFSGAIRMPDGTLAIATELAPHKDVMEAIRKLDKAVEDGHVSPTAAHAAKMTLLKDMAAGMLHMHEAGGTIHRDFKPPNVFIGDGGVAKIADFGTTITDDTYNVSSSTKIDNPIWQAPEILYAKSEAEDVARLKFTPMRGEVSLVRQEVERQFFGRLSEDAPPLSSSQARVRDDIVKGIMSVSIDGKLSDISLGRTGDTWALGMTALNLFVEPEFMADETFMSTIERRIVEFGSDPEHRALGDEEGSFYTTPFDGAVSALINDLMHPDPTRRPSLDQVMDHESLRFPGTGSQAARDLIVAVMSGDVDGMKTASDELQPPELE